MSKCPPTTTKTSPTIFESLAHGTRVQLTWRDTRHNELVSVTGRVTDVEPEFEVIRITTHNREGELHLSRPLEHPDVLVQSVTVTGVTQLGTLLECDVQHRDTPGGPLVRTHEHTMEGRR